MRCVHCGSENDGGVYRCQTCGNSLLPPLPHQAYLSSAVLQNLHTGRRMKRVLVVFVSAGILILSAGFCSLAFISAQAVVSQKGGNQEKDEPALAIEEALPEELQKFLQVEIQDGQLHLPGSDIWIGVPAYKNYSCSIQNTPLTTIYTFVLTNGLTMEISCWAAEYPFTKSVEEEYFMQENNYDRLVGEEEQYMIAQSSEQEVYAIVIDRLHATSYRIRLFGNEETDRSLIEKAHQIFDQIVIDQSSLVKKAV